jgi:hypothetical protein
MGLSARKPHENSYMLRNTETTANAAFLRRQPGKYMKLKK